MAELTPHLSAVYHGSMASIITNYSSTGGTTTTETPDVTYDAKIVIDMETANKHSPGKESLATGLKVTAHQSSDAGVPGAGAITIARFTKGLDVNMVNKVTDVDGTTLNGNTVEAILLVSFKRGRFETTFDGKVKIGAAATVAGRHIYGIRIGSIGLT